MSTPSNLRTSTSAPSCSPWDTDLEQECKKINDDFGYQGKRYIDLLDQLSQSFQDQLKSQDSCSLLEKFELVENMMPKSIRVRKDVLKRISSLRNRLIFKNLEKKIQDTIQSSQLIPYEKELKTLHSSLTYSEEDQSLKKEISLCLDFCHQKWLTCDFVETVRSQERKVYPILSIDGGGIRGIIPATVAVEIEKITGQPMAHSFDLFGGTSTGGILALGFTKPHDHDPRVPQYRAQDILNLYTQENHHIFRNNPDYREDTSNLDWQERIQCAIRYPRYLAPELFEHKFGHHRLSTALKDVVITANSEKAVISKLVSVAGSAISKTLSAISSIISDTPLPTWSSDSIAKKIDFFTKRGLKSVHYSLGDLERIAPEDYKLDLKNHDFPMAKVAQVTSSAPTYFPYVDLQGTYFLDGGILQNNPTIPCVLEAVNRGVPRRDLLVVSLGTGVAKSNVPPRDLGTLAASLWLETTQPHEQEDKALRNMLSSGAYYRFQYQFPGHAPELNDTSPETIDALVEQGKELVENSSDYIREVCRVLKPGCI